MSISNLNSLQKNNVPTFYSNKNVSTLKNLAILSIIKHSDSFSTSGSSSILPAEVLNCIIQTAARRDIPQEKAQHLFQVCQQNKNFDIFTFWSNRETYSYYTHEKDFFSSCSWKNFKKIDITGCRLNDLDTFVNKVANEALELQELSLWDCGFVGDLSCNLLITKCKELTSLKIQLCVYKLIQHPFPFPQENNLKKLCLSVNNVTLSFFFTLIKNNSHLNELIIWTYCFFSEYKTQFEKEGSLDCTLKKTIIFFIDDNFNGFLDEDFPQNKRYPYNVNMQMGSLEINFSSISTKTFTTPWLCSNAYFSEYKKECLDLFPPKKSKNFNPLNFEALISSVQHNPRKIEGLLFNGLIGFDTKEKQNEYLNQFAEIFIKTISFEGLLRLCSSFTFPKVSSEIESQMPWFKPVIEDFFYNVLIALKKKNKEDSEKFILLKNFCSRLPSLLGLKSKKFS